MERIKEIVLTPLFITAVIILLGIGVMAFFVINSKNTTITSESAPYVTYYQIAGMRYSDNMKATVEPAVTIEEFGDFQCPACGTLYQTKLFDLVQAKYGDKVKFVFRQFPLTNIHSYALRSAEGSLAAGAQGKFWEMYNKIYENQTKYNGKGPTENDLVDLAKEVGVSDIARFERELKQGVFREAVRKDMSLGDDKRVNQTPTIFINGDKYTGDWTLDAISPSIDKILNK